MHLLLQLLDVSCNVNQLFGGQKGRTPTLTATFIHWRSAGGGGSWAGKRPTWFFSHLRGWSLCQHLCNTDQDEDQVNRNMVLLHMLCWNYCSLKYVSRFHLGLPHQETWHIVHRAAAWASRGDESKVTGRLCLTNISLDRTTAPQIPAGGMHCQLDMNRHI